MLCYGTKCPLLKVFFSLSPLNILDLVHFDVLVNLLVGKIPIGNVLLV